MTDVAQAIAHLTQAARQAGRDQATGKGSGSEIPVNAARTELLHLLDRLGIDGGGWHSEREILAAKVEELEAKILDLCHRLEQERERADAAMARVDDLEEELSVLGALDRAKAMIAERAS